MDRLGRADVLGEAFLAENPPREGRPGCEEADPGFISEKGWPPENSVEDKPVGLPETVCQLRVPGSDHKPVGKKSEIRDVDDFVDGCWASFR